MTARPVHLHRGFFTACRRSLANVTWSTSESQVTCRRCLATTRPPRKARIHVLEPSGKAARCGVRSWLRAFYTLEVAAEAAKTSRTGETLCGTCKRRSAGPTGNAP